MSLIDEVRKFTDDDIRFAVAFLEMHEFNLDRAIQIVEANDPAAACLLDTMSNDTAATVQLLIVTDSFRNILGLTSNSDQQRHEVS